MERNSAANSVDTTIPELVVTLENPIAIKSNFPQLKTWLSNELKKYEIEVTAETLQDAKRAAAELNALAKKLDDARKEYKRKFSEPISAWEEEAKALHQAALSAREKIVAQTKVFDDKTRDLCRILMIDLLGEEYQRLEVRPEYQRGFDQITNLVGTSKVTNSGNLTKAARENIEGLAQNGRLAQEKADGRMARVEADCRAAGFEPFTREMVSSILDLDDASFSGRLTKMIADESKRQESAREKIRKEEQQKAEREARAKAEAEEKARKEKEAAEAKVKADAETKAKKEQEDRDAAERINTTVAENTTPEPTPIPEPVTQPASTDEEKKIVALKLCFLVEVQAKINTSPEIVQKVVGKIVLEAIKNADPRIVSVEAAS